MAFNKDRLIVAQNSATVAAALLGSMYADISSYEELVEVFEEVRNAVFEGSIALADGAIPGQDEATVSRAPSRGRSGGRGGGNTPSDSGAGVTLRFGKYRGKSIGDIYDTDPEYITWLSETCNNEFVKDKCVEFLASV